MTQSARSATVELKHNENKFGNTSLKSDAEQSSWIADDICTRCGGLAPHGKLYCSQKCRNEDAVSEPCKGLVSAERSFPKADSLSHLRYPMSPPIFPTTSASSMQKQISMLSLSRKSSVSSLSSNDVKRTHVRHNSHSSDSANSDNVETDFTTPSPWQGGVDEGEDTQDKLSDIESVDLQLPPALCKSSQVNLHSKELLKPGSLSNGRRAAWVSPKLVPHSMTQTRSALSQIQFNRLPSSTNLPSNSVPFMLPVTTPSKTHLFRTRSNEASSMSPNKNEIQTGPIMRHNTATSPIVHIPDVNASSQGSDLETHTEESEPKRSNPDICSTMSSSLSKRCVYDRCDMDILKEKSQYCVNGCSPEFHERGRTLERRGHSCLSGHRRSVRAACDPCTLSCLSTYSSGRFVSSPQEFLFPICSHDSSVQKP